MGVLGKDKNQAILYYNSNNPIGKQTYAYVASSNKAILAIDTNKDNATGTIWAEIAMALELKISELINQSHPDFQAEYGKTPIVMDDSGWLKILDKKPNLASFSILVLGEKVYKIENPSDVIKFIKPDSAGLEKPYK